VNAVLHLSLSVQALDAKLQRYLGQLEGIRGIPSALKAEFKAILTRVDAASETVVNLSSFARWNGKILEAIAGRCDQVGVGGCCQCCEGSSAKSTVAGKLVSEKCSSTVTTC
jgi:hypothetical protein